MLPPPAKPQNAADAIPAKLLHSSLNKLKHPINVVRWTPEGRRLLTGSSIGEFTLWNGMGFNFETISQVSETLELSINMTDAWMAGTRLSRKSSGMVTQRRLAHISRSRWYCKILAAYIQQCQSNSSS